MRRDVAFAAYLKDHYAESTAKHYMDYCKTIEKRMGDKDMDILVSSPTEITATKVMLEARYKASSFTQMWNGFKAYMDFASSAVTAGWVTRTPATGAILPSAAATGLVVYENSVPSDEKVDRLCAYLEAEYDKIRAFAQEMLKGIWQVFPAIPVYLSKECPKETYVCNWDKLLEKMRKQCKDCGHKNCEPPHCPAFRALMEEKPFSDLIRGRYFPGKEAHIVIYFKNFPTPHKLSNQDFAASIAKTLAHEYLHFLHDYYARTLAGTPTKPATDEKLSEALADFFGVAYSLRQGNRVVAEDRYDLWKQRQYTDWPYSYALKFFAKPYLLKLADYLPNEMDQATQKFREVFAKTNDPKTALKLLMS